MSYFQKFLSEHNENNISKVIIGEKKPSEMPDAFKTQNNTGNKINNSAFNKVKTPKKEDDDSNWSVFGSKKDNLPNAFNKSRGREDKFNKTKVVKMTEEEKKQKLEEIEDAKGKNNIVKMIDLQINNIVKDNDKKENKKEDDKKDTKKKDKKKNNNENNDIFNSLEAKEETYEFKDENDAYNQLIEFKKAGNELRNLFKIVVNDYPNIFKKYLLHILSIVKDKKILSKPEQWAHRNFYGDLLLFSFTYDNVNTFKIIDDFMDEVREKLPKNKEIINEVIARLYLYLCQNSILDSEEFYNYFSKNTKSNHTLVIELFEKLADEDD